MLSLTWIFKLNNYISYLFPRPPPWKNFLSFIIYILSRRFHHGLFKSLSGDDFSPWSYWPYCKILFHLHPLLSGLPSDGSPQQPEDVSWDELRDFIRWLQKERSLSDRTINACISQLRFFTIYVLHRPWDPTQLPMRRFDSYLPYVPTQKEADIFISSLSDLKPKAMVSLMSVSYTHLTLPTT